jgi:hypothetical protein
VEVRAVVGLYAQGDILIERVAARCVSGRVVQSADDGSVVVADGEASGHRHRILGSVTMYRDDVLAREIPPGLYVGHVQVEGPSALLEHEEHASIGLPHGTYRIRRQRQLEPTDIGIYEYINALED